MKEMNEVLKNKLQMSHAGLKSCKWSDIYDTEDELINDLLCITIRGIYPNPTKGNVYLSSFQARLKRNESLTAKQMSMLKRFAQVVAYERYCRG